MDYTQIKYNDLSSALAAEVRKFLPKKGQVIYFESIRPKARGTSVLPYDRIHDPYKGANGEGDFVDIAYITGYTSPKPGEPSMPVFAGGRNIQFTRDMGGRIAIHGGNRDHENLFMFLYLTNQRTQNSGAKWFVSAQGRHGIFKMVEPKKTAADQMKIKRDITKAMQVIDNLAGIKLREIALGLDLKGITEHSDEDEIRLQLAKIAEKPDGNGAAKIINLENDEHVKAKTLIKHATRLGLIVRDDVLRIWVSPDTGDQICTIPPNMKADDALVTFFVDNKVKGGDWYRHLSQQVQSLRKKDEEIKPAPEPEVFKKPEAENVVVQVPVEKPKPGRPKGTTKSK